MVFQQNKPTEDPGRNELITMMYELAANPHSFGRFLASWEAMNDRIDDHDAQELQLDEHIRRATRIMSRIDHGPADRVPPLAETIAHDSYPCILLSHKGDVLGANKEALTKHACQDADDIQALIADDPKIARQIRTLCNQASGQLNDNGPAIGLLRLPQDDAPLMVFSRVSCPHDARVCGMLTARGPTWDPRTTRLVRDVFNLTEAEASVLRDGRTLTWTTVGPDNGYPVLFLHGLIDSIDMTDQVHDLLHQYRLRLIAPVCPNFGPADPLLNPNASTNLYLSDCLALLDNLGLRDVPVIGHMAGAVYARLLAGQYPERVQALWSVAGGVPMKHRWQIASMSKGHRISARAAQRVPRLLPILIQGGIQLLRSKGEDAMMNLYLADAAVDRTHALAPDIRQLLLKRFDFATRQGPRAFSNDITQISIDWSSELRPLHCPLHLFHGAQDRVVLPRGVSE